ncbi:prepilin-type N-terminal cleavage/methylation domain-containing protein, partial [Candidatus Wolfebacteria bacterium]|nr:prepilin-type N-terminal cleavage/methylation domain-containing protein [Candidatus Wolfebacteria bacterium]
MVFRDSQKGQLLLEILVAIAVVAVVVGAGSQIVFVSMKSNKSAGEKNSAQGLSVETFETV